MSRDEQIVEMRRNGATYKEIQAELQCCQQVVYRALWRAGLVGARRSKLSEEQIQEICDLRREDPKTWVYMRLAQRFDVSTSVINKVLKSAGLTR